MSAAATPFFLPALCKGGTAADMRAAVLAAIIGLAAVLWFAVAARGSAESAAAVRERFQGDSRERFQGDDSEASKRNELVADVMDMYKDAYGRYPRTEVLVHYRDAATAVVSALTVAAGASMVRVHDVAATDVALRVAGAIVARGV